jgi:hypothetical protein
MGDRFARVPIRAARLRLRAQDLSVLICISGHANGDGIARPSQGRIASLTGIGRPHVAHSIARLEQAGLLRRHRHKSERGDWDNSTYEILFDDPSQRTEAENRGRDAPSPRGDDRAVSEFDRFWRAYPHRGEHPNPRKPANLEFDAAVKKGVDPTVIIRGAEIYAAYVAANITDRSKVAQAITWLGQERWADQQQPPETPRMRAGMI